MMLCDGVLSVAGSLQTTTTAGTLSSTTSEPCWREETKVRRLSRKCGNFVPVSGSVLMTERLAAISSVRTSHYFFGGKEEGRRYFSRLFDLMRFSEDYGAQQSVFQLVCSLFPRDSLLDVPALFSLQL